jgi:hypothetical protein
MRKRRKEGEKKGVRKEGEEEGKEWRAGWRGKQKENCRRYRNERMM